MAPNGFTWIEKPRLAALALPQAREDFTWLRAEGIESFFKRTDMSAGISGGGVGMGGPIEIWVDEGDLERAGELAAPADEPS